MNPWVDTDLHDSRNAREAVRLSALVYFDSDSDRSIGASVRFHNKITDTDAYGWVSDKQILIAWRGTSSGKDVRTDLKFHKVPFLTADESGTSAFSVCDIKTTHHGYVHRGFLSAVSSVWPNLLNWIRTVYEGQPIFIMGHSLGGANAVVSAMRLDLAGYNVTAVYTFGCPRVGDIKFARLFDERIRHYRYVNHNDVVTRLPPSITFARHTGFEYYFNRFGECVVLGSLGKAWDRLIGRLTQSVVDGIKDHAINEYVRLLK